jgi:hypothetical protein
MSLKLSTVSVSVSDAISALKGCPREWNEDAGTYVFTLPLGSKATLSGNAAEVSAVLKGTK